MRLLTLKVKASEIFCPEKGQILAGHGLEKVSIFTAKGTSVRGST